jgi:hypothetical protein
VLGEQQDSRAGSQLPAPDEASPLERSAEESARLLLLDTQRWIHRRVERVQYTDSELLRWQFSVDFTIPEGVPGIDHGKEQPRVYFVPIALMRKWPPLMSLDVRDEVGAPVPLLTSEKNRRVDAAALAGLLPVGSLGDALRDTARDIALATTIVEARAHIETLGETVRLAVPELSVAAADEWLRVVGVAASLAWNSLLWARVKCVPGERRIVKVGFETLAPASAPWWRRLIPTSGLAGEWLRLDLHNLGERGSYHLEFIPPLGTDVLEARLWLRDPLERRAERPSVRHPIRRWKWWQSRRKRWRAEKYSGRARKLRFVRSIHRSIEEGPLPDRRTPYSRNLLSRAHFYVGDSAGEGGRAHIRLGPSRRDFFLSGALFAAGLTTGLLWFAYASAERLTESKHEGPTVTVMLLLPAVLSYLFTQPLPHPVARRMIVGVRIMTRTVTLLPAAAALVMLGLTKAKGHGNPDVDLIETWWLGMALTASVLTAILALAAKVLPRAAVGELYGPL